MANKNNRNFRANSHNTMRITVFLLFLLVIMQGCKTYSYFTSPNNLVNKDCQVFLTDNTEIDGKLTVQFETENDAGKYLKVLTGANTERKILVKDIKYYQYNNEFYFPKDVNLETYVIPVLNKIYTPEVSNVLFLKRLTGDSAKLQLFELYKSKANTSDGADHFDYFISFPNENRFASWSIRGTKFFPGFEEKMSTIVADCPSLADKIKQKAQGYTLKQVSMDAKKLEVVKKIVEEYNNCK